MTDTSPITELTLKRLFTAAALLMLLPLPVLQYLGEEGLMAIKSYEMFVRNDWLHPSILGGVWPHSPFWHWPVIAIASLIGWEHVDIAIRLVSVTSSWIAALAAGFAAARLFPQHPQARWLAALIYLTLGEVAFWYGWLGYVDAMFGMFIFTAIVCLWRAIEDEHFGWFAASLILISLAFLTKNITAYALYGVTGLILLWRLQHWRLLIKPHFLLAGCAALSVPWLWQTFVVPTGANTATTSVNDALRNFIGFGFLAYIKHWLLYPVLFAARALPVTLVLLWLWLRKRQQFRLDATLTTLLIIIAACMFPFWISAAATPRYLMPLYGLAALLLTGLVLQLDAHYFRKTILVITVFIVLKIPYSLGILPYIKQWQPGNNAFAVAKEIQAIVGDSTLRTRNDISTGLAVAAYLDVRMPPERYIRWLGDDEHKFYVLTEDESPDYGILKQQWVLRGDPLYLYWKP